MKTKWKRRKYIDFTWKMKATLPSFKQYCFMHVYRQDLLPHVSFISKENLEHYDVQTDI
jgi:hypothetical protein